MEQLALARDIKQSIKYRFLHLIRLAYAQHLPPLGKAKEREMQKTSLCDINNYPPEFCEKRTMVTYIDICENLCYNIDKLK